MLEAAGAPAAPSYEQIEQSLRSLVGEYEHLDSSCAQELARKLRAVAQQLEAGCEITSGHGAAPGTDATSNRSRFRESLERRWGAASSKGVASGSL